MSVKRVIFSLSSVIMVFALSLSKLWSIKSEYGDEDIALLKLIFDFADPDSVFFYGFILGSSLPLLFALLFGAYVYGDLMISSVYLFTRQKSRTRWYMSRCLRLGGYALIYSAFFLISSLVILCILNDKSIVYCMLHCIDGSLVYIWLGTAAVCYISALFFNLLSIGFGTSIGYVLGIFFFIADAYAAAILNGKKTRLLDLNPLTIYLRACCEKPDAAAVGMCALAVAIFSVIGFVIIKNADIALSNKEV